MLGDKAQGRGHWGHSVLLESPGKLCVSNRCCSPCHEQEINSALPAPSWTWNQLSFLLLRQSWPKNRGEDVWVLVSWSCPFHLWALHTLPQAETWRLLNQECSLFVGGREKWEGRRCTWRQGGENCKANLGKMTYLAHIQTLKGTACGNTCHLGVEERAHCKKHFQNRAESEDVEMSFFLCT